MTPYGLPLDTDAQVAVLQDDLRPSEADAILDRMLEDPAFKEQSLKRLEGVIQRKKEA